MPGRPSQPRSWPVVRGAADIWGNPQSLCVASRRLGSSSQSVPGSLETARQCQQQPDLCTCLGRAFIPGLFQPQLAFHRALGLQRFPRPSWHLPNHCLWSLRTRTPPRLRPHSATPDSPSQAPISHAPTQGHPQPWPPGAPCFSVSWIPVLSPQHRSVAAPRIPACLMS